MKTWKDSGVPVTFRLGDEHELFGEDLRKLRGPCYERGYLPVVRMTYEHDGTVFTEESFASVEPGLAEHGVLFTRFLLGSGKPGQVVAHIDSAGPVSVSQGVLSDAKGHVLVGSATTGNGMPTKRILSPI
ncbi:MAG: hypothetical protein DME25_07780 [Verrucomicrobia bacterium]|nr:MAG: hypothetical protein DME25_07780 [Verrucomicrobiota bacterium]